ncbi:MAG: hypothetical protein FWD60_10065 [Candidatus Azobacteroides sp.]|nr:hypothetical protein [Candidatus Azobacteroides sp.]
MMKLKSKLITGIIIVCFLVGITTLHAQGLYRSNSSDNNNNAIVNTTSTSTQSGYSKGGMFRGDDDPGSEGDDGDADPGGTSHQDPIGGGMLILSLLSGAYALVKKKNIRNRNEE